MLLTSHSGIVDGRTKMVLRQEPLMGELIVALTISTKAILAVQGRLRTAHVALVVTSAMG